MRIVNVNGEPLTPRQGLKLASFLLKLLNSTSKILYRRLNEDILKEKYNLLDESYYEDLSMKLFMVGEKGRTYLNREGRNISDISENTFADIFDRFHKVFTKSKNQEVIEFQNKGKTFSSFFEDKQNKAEFLLRISAITFNKDKQYIRDYYYTLLQRIGSFAIKNNSPMISTTENSVIADNFIGKRIYKGNIDRSIKMIIIRRPFYSTKNVLKTYKLPYCNCNIIYPEQSEYSFKGAITPNRILGYIRLDTKNFIVNPAFLSSTQSEDDMLTNGINIDQSDFDEVLHKTNYQRGCQTDEEDFYEDFNRE